SRRGRSGPGGCRWRGLGWCRSSFLQYTKGRTALEPRSPMVTGARRVARGSPDLAGRGRRARYGITLSAAAPEVARAVVAPAPHGPAPDARGGCDGDER